MSEWKKEELEAISKDKSLYISIPNPDGSMHRPTWIWVTQVGDEVYCRGYSGTATRWYQSAKREGSGHISVGGVEKDVRFEFPTDEQTNNQVDKGFRQKYGSNPYSEQDRQVTVRLIPIN